MPEYLGSFPLESVLTNNEFFKLLALVEYIETVERRLDLPSASIPASDFLIQASSSLAVPEEIRFNSLIYSFE